MRPSEKPTDPDPIGSAVAASRIAKMGTHEISYMLASVARIPLVFMAASTRLTTDLFESDEADYVLTWRAMTAAAEASGGLLPGDAAAAKELVSLYASREAATDTKKLYYTHKVVSAVCDDGGLLDEMYALPLTAEIHATAMDLLVRFTTERKAMDPLRRAMAGLSDKETIKDLASLMSVIEGHARDIAGLATDPGSDAVVDADEFTPPAPNLVTTGQKWLDTLLGGGQAKKEAYVILGPTGGGKSCLGVQVAVDGAELQASLVGDVGAEEAGHWYIFTWELNSDQLRERVYAYGARISRNTFAEIDPRTRRPTFSSADRPDSLHQYEFEPFVNSPGNPTTGELDRMRTFRKRLAGINSRLHLVDYSGQITGTGAGGIREVVGYLRMEATKGRKVAGVVFDYAGLAVQRFISASGLRPESEYNLLASFVDQVRSQVAVPMDCTAWVLHQLHGDVTKKAPGAKIHHSEARGCRNFADNSDFSFQLTPYNRLSGLLTVHCTKHRRAPGLEDGAIVRFDGRFGAFRDPDQEYVVDPLTRQIVPRDFVSGGGPFGGSTTQAGGPFVDPRTII